MAFIKEIQTPDNIKHQIKNTIIPVIGTQTSSTSSWTGNIDLPSLYDGLTIAYFLPYNSVSGTSVSLTLTLNDGSQTNPIACYISSGRLGTQYTKGSNIIMTYWSKGSINIDGTVTTNNRWIAHADYNTDVDTDTWRNIKVNGTEVLGTGTGTGALDFINGTNTTVSYDSGIKINATDTKNTAGSTDTSDKIFLIGAKSQAANPQTYSDNQVYVTNGSLFLTKPQDASGTADNKPALLIGDPTSAHLELDTNEVMAKDSATTTGPLYLNNAGGLVYVNNKKVVRLTSDPTSGQVMIADGTDGQIKSSGWTIESSVPSDAVFTDTWTALTGATSSANGSVGYINAVPPKNGYNTKFFRADGSWAIPANDNYYHTTGSWSGLTYTATANGGAGALEFTIPTGTTSSTVAVGNHNHDDTYLKLSGGTLTGSIYVSGTTEKRISLKNSTNNSLEVYMASATNGRHGLYSTGYLNGTTYTQSGKWLVMRDSDGKVYFNGCTIESSVPSDAVFTDEKVKNEIGTSNIFYPAGRTSNSTGTGTQVFDASMKFAGTTNGKAQLVLGNSTADGTEGGRFGQISIYSKSTSYGNLLQENVSSSVTHTFPATGGTILNTGNYDKYALPLTGGTMTGAINFKSSNLDRNNPPSSETTSDVYCNFQDKDGNYIGRVVSAMNENGDIELILRARARNAADTGYILNDFKIIKSRNGTSSYSISSPTNFRTAIQALGFSDTKALLQATIGHSCKNLLKITATSTTKNGVTFNVNSTTGIITASEKSSTNFYYTVGSIVNTSDTAMNLYMSGCADGGSTSKYYVYAYDTTANARPKKWNGSSSSGESISSTDEEEIQIPAGHTVQIRIYIKTNYPGQNTTITFKPMVRDGNILNNTFEPYQTPTDEAKQDKLQEYISTTPSSSVFIDDISNLSYFIVNIVYQDSTPVLGPDDIYSVFISIGLLDSTQQTYFHFSDNNFITVYYTNSDTLVLTTNDNNYKIKSIVYFYK